jgi:hypothetical protein
MVPDGMTSEIHQFDAREGGSFRVSLTYDAPTGTGKTTARTDTYHGRFVALVPDEQVVRVVEFETADPGMGGEMTISMSLLDADGGTEIVAVSSPYTTTCRPVSRLPTTSSAGACRSESWRRSWSSAEPGAGAPVRGAYPGLFELGVRAVQSRLITP